MLPNAPDQRVDDSLDDDLDQRDPPLSDDGLQTMDPERFQEDEAEDFDDSDALEDTDEFDDLDEDSDEEELDEALPASDDVPGDEDQGSSDRAEDPTAPLAVPDDHLADSIQLALTFHVGETQMSLKQLRRLLPGYTFELATRMESPVAIQAYGQTIGRGELVQIGQRLGVRLLEINQDAS